MDARNMGRSRREFLRVASSAALSASVLSGVRLAASTSCLPTGLCTSQVDFSQFAQTAFQTQQLPEWCWAACISMIFAFYGHPVSQARIVSEVYGAPVNMPAVYGVQLASQLNKKWTDDSGACFRARLSGVYDAQAGVDTLTNADLVNELDGDHPVVIGSGGHAMVLTAMQYWHTPGQPTVVSCGVFDPWPGRGARTLSPPEMLRTDMGGELAFVATARVTNEDC
jgi:hypothetical protein